VRYSNDKLTRRPEQIMENVAAAQNVTFSDDELRKIDEIVN